MMKMRFFVLLLLISSSSLYAEVNMTGTQFLTSDFYATALPGGHLFMDKNLYKFWEAPNWWSLPYWNPCVLSDEEYDTNCLQFSVMFHNCEDKQYSYHRSLVNPLRFDNAKNKDELLSQLNELEEISSNLSYHEGELLRISSRINELRHSIFFGVQQMLAAFGCFVGHGVATVTLLIDAAEACKLTRDIISQMIGYNEYFSLMLEYKQEYIIYQDKVYESVKISSSLVNKIFESSNSIMRDLEFKGVDYEGYTGGAKSIYEDALDFRSGGLDNTDAEYYDNVLKYESEMYNYYNNLYYHPDQYYSITVYSPPQQCNYVELMVLNNDSLFIRGLALYSKLKNAQDIMEQEYQNLTSVYNELKDERNNVYNDYRWINSITDIPSEVEFEAREALPIHDFAPDTVQGFISASDDAFSLAETKYEEAEISYDNDDEYQYLGKAYENMVLANMYMNQSIAYLDDAKQSGDVLVQATKDVYERYRSECDGFYETANEDIKLILLSRLETAENLAKEGSDLGETYNNYKQAYIIAKECVQIAETGEIPATSVKEVLKRLKQVIDAAKKDNIDVSAEEEWYNNNKDISLSGDMLSEALSMLSSVVDSKINGICTKAENEYSDIFDKRREIKSLLSDITGYISVTDFWNRYHKHDQYFESSNSIRCPYAIGHLSSIRKDYDKLYSDLEGNVHSALESMLSSPSHYSVRIDNNQTPVLDKPVHMKARITVTNPTDLSSLNVSISIPFAYEVYDSDITDRSEEIGYVSKTGKSNPKIQFVISEVSAHKTYYIVFDWDELVCVSTNREDEISLAGASMANGEREVSYSCGRTVDRIFSYENLGVDFVDAECDSCTDIKHINRTSVKLTLDNLRKGKGKYILYYSVSTPYNLSKSNVSTTESQGYMDVSYIIYITDVKLPLKSIRIGMSDEIGSNTSVSKFQIEPLSVAKATSVDHTIINQVLSYWFTVNSINPGEEYQFHVSYTVDNCVQYSETMYLSLYNDVMNSNQQDLISMLEQAEAYMDAGNCAKASKKLIELKSNYEDWLRQVGIDKLIFEENIDGINESINEMLSITNLLHDNNLSEEAHILTESYDNATQLLLEALDYYNLGDYENAVNSMYNASSLSDVDLYSVLYEARQRLSDKRDSLWNLWIHLGTDNSSVTDMFKQVDEKLASLRSLKLTESDLPLLGEISTLLNTIENTISSKSSGTVAELLEDINDLKSLIESMISPLLNNYKQIYNGLHKFSPNHAESASFPVKIKDAEKVLSNALKRLDRYKDKLSDCDESCIRITSGDINELYTEVNRTYSQLLNAMEKINETINTNIRLSEHNIPKLMEKGVNTAQITEYINSAKNALASNDMITAFKESARAYDLTFELVGGLKLGNEREDFTVIMIGVAVIIGVAVLVYAFKRFMPSKAAVDVGKRRLGKGLGKESGKGISKDSDIGHKRTGRIAGATIHKRRLRSYKYYKRRNRQL